MSNLPNFSSNFRYSRHSYPKNETIHLTNGTTLNGTLLNDSTDITSSFRSINYVTKGSNLSKHTVKTVNTVSYLCSEPRNARMPSTTTKYKHLMTPDVATCQLECMEAGKRNCNVFTFEKSEFAPNCTLGYHSNFTEPLASTTDTGPVSGYCIPMSEAVSNVFYPPLYN